MDGAGQRLWLVFLLCFTSAVAAAAPVSADDPIPPYEGDLQFPEIQGSAAPEEYAWRVQLAEGQTLETVDDRLALVRYVDGHPAFSITTEGAHAADGATVPTTLAVSEGDILTLTVHHRAGNPAEGGAPFDYPVVAGMGWEGGFQPPVLIPGPPDERQLREVREREEREVRVDEPITNADYCVVPRLKGLRLPGVRRRLRAAGCQIGAVKYLRSRRTGTPVVVRQSPTGGRTVPAGTRVLVSLRGGAAGRGSA